MTAETELKLSLPNGHNTAFRRLLSERAGTPAIEERLRSIYFDTPELALAQRDMALRLRQVEGGWVQTLKLAEQAGGGLHQRVELESAVAGEALELDRIADDRANRFLRRPDIADDLTPLFITDIVRTRWELDDALGNRVEVALDCGTIRSSHSVRSSRSGEHVVTINEVEIELLAGNADTLFGLALDWARQLPLIPDTQSKAARGYALYLQTPAAGPGKARPAALAAKMSPRQGLRAAVAEALRQLQTNVPGILASDHPEFVHQARVALRRLRSAQWAFRGTAPAATLETLTDEFRWLAGVLGELRDLDVLLAQTLPDAQEDIAEGVDFAALRKHIERRRARCRRQVRATLRSARYGALLIRLLQWLHSDGDDDATAAEPLHRFARRTLKKRRRRILQLAGDWQAASPAELHDLRKKIKKLRYAGEFFSPLLNSKKWARRLGELKSVQQALGKMNDATTARSLLAQLASEDASISYAAGVVAGWTARQAQESHGALAGLMPGAN